MRHQRIGFKTRMHIARSTICALAAITAAVFASAQQTPDSDHLLNMSLDDLLKVEVTTASKKAEPQRQAPTAITVITQDDIRRSGATSVPDVLRNVPGLAVARLDANKWSITARGFSGRFANKLLVLVDGVSTYSSLFSGMFWDAVDVPLEDIERIEVIRGPGGTLWGANAVNGVINIITFDASKTTGGLASLGAGTENRARAFIRYGGALPNKANLRLSTEYQQRDNATFSSGDEAHDAWESIIGNLRLDWAPTDEDHITVIARQIAWNADETFQLPSLIPPYLRVSEEKSYYAESTLSSSYTHAFDEDSELQLQFYYRYRHANTILFDDDRFTVDLDLQYRFKPADRHTITADIAFRYLEDNLTNYVVQFDPSARADWIVSGFIQDDIVLLEDELRLIVGAKLEHNDYSGLEVQPSARMLWTPDEQQTIWGAISRAVRTPSRAEDDIHLPSIALPGVLISLTGDRAFDSEKLLAYELGYRVSPNESLYLDLAVFLNKYWDLRTTEIGAPYPAFTPFPPHLEVPVVAHNNFTATTYGAEASLTWEVRPSWMLQLTYSYFSIDTKLRPKTIDIITGSVDGDSPKHMASLYNHFDLGKNTEFDLTLRYVDDLPGVGVDSYFTADARIGWRPKPNVELSLVGQNLLEPHREEYAATYVNTLPSDVERGIYAQIRWEF
jgi:iron complex outermembrane receptor protein